jgi:PEGA domain
MSRLPLVLTAVAIGLHLTGCATITRGTTEVLVIESEPTGATATLSSGNLCKTPCSIELKRKHDYHVKIEKPGYETTDTDVKSEISGAGAAGMAGNVILGGLIGAGVDAATGATKKLTPNPLKIKMEPILPPPGPQTPMVTTEAAANSTLPHGAANGGPGADSPVAANLNDVPVEKICDQPTHVERLLCKGELAPQMSRDAVIQLLGQPSAKNDTGLVLRYDDRYLRFDGAGRLTQISNVN